MSQGLVLFAISFNISFFGGGLQSQSRKESEVFGLIRSRIQKNDGSLSRIFIRLRLRKQGRP